MVLYLGTVVTGSGPHSGDLDSRRTGLDPQVMSHVHAAAVYLLRRPDRRPARAGPPVAARRAGPRRLVLLVVELAQGVVGFVQYFPDLPEVLVAIHMLGAALISAARPGWSSARLPPRGYPAE